MFLLGYETKKETCCPFAIRKIVAIQGEDKRTWEFKYPFTMEKNTTYIFLVDFPKGQDKQKESLLMRGEEK